MPRTRTVVVDQDNSWIAREEFTFDPSDPVPPEEDYFVLTTGFPVWYNAHSSYSEIVIWGVGVVSFGPVTAAQTAFMANLGGSPDLSLFPGDFAAFGFSSQQLEHFQYGLKEDYVYVTSETNPMISITPDGMTVIGASSAGAYFGIDYGGFQATSGSSASLFFSDLDVTSGSKKADTMIGAEGPETLLGLGGNDHLIGNGGGDRLEGGRGNDVLEGNAGNDRLFGGDDADTLYGGDGNDRLFGDNGNDLLVPGSGFDDVDGGAGIDRLWLDYGSSTSSLYFQFGPGLISTAGGFRISVANVESVRIDGSNHSDVIAGTAFDDELHGGNGFDLLRGFAGNDLLDGGANGGTAVAILPTAGDTLQTALPIDHYFSLSSDADIGDSTTVPHATLTVPLNTDQFGDPQETSRFIALNVTQTGAILTVDVDETFLDVDTRVLIYDSNGTLLDSNDDAADTDAGSSNPADSFLSHTFNDLGTYYVEVVSVVFTANHNSNFSVNFSLTSATVPLGDELAGGTGNDFYLVHSSADTVTELAGEGTDRVVADASFTLGGNVENLDLAGTSAIDGTGNGLANAINGNVGANSLSGLGGNDILNGGLGNDVLNGGSGADRYLFDAALNASGNVDDIVDFSSIDDTIVLDRTVFTKLSTGTLADSRFYAGTAAHDSTDRIIYDSTTGNLYFDPDGSGGAAQTLFAHLTPGTTLSNSDFLVVP